MLTSLSTKSKKTVPPLSHEFCTLTSVMTGVCLLENKKREKEFYSIVGTVPI